MRLSSFAVLVALPAALVAQNAQRPRPQNTGGGLPFVSADGKTIAYNATRDTTQGDIYVINADGTNERQLTHTPSNDGAPSFAGNRVLTWARADSATSLVTVDVTGGNMHRVRMPLDAREFRLSPDGKWLLYSAGPWQSAKLYVSGPEGGNPRAITDGTVALFNAAWSADGKRIAYTSMDSTRQLQIGVMNADGSAQRIITKFTKDDGSPQWPSWSPDSRTIAVQSGKYSRVQSENTAHIWLIDVASGKATKLAAHDKNYLDETPSFFPDGKRIAFQSDRTGVMHVWVMNVDGTGAKQVTSWKP